MNEMLLLIVFSRPYREEAEFEAASELTFRPDNALTAGRFPEVRIARAEVCGSPWAMNPLNFNPEPWPAGCRLKPACRLIAPT